MISEQPRTIVECGSCGENIDGEIGKCPRCRGGVYEGPIYVYYPVAHGRKAGIDFDSPTERVKLV